MASIDKIILFNETAVAASANGDAYTARQRSKDHIGWLVVANASSINGDAKIQHSAYGTNWVDLASFTTFTSNTIEAVDITTGVLGHVRAVYTRTGGTADIRIELCFDPNK